MEPVSSVDVKRLVREDLKKRKITQTKIAKDWGLSRQTVAAILSPENYFSGKYANFFSLAYGYSPDFLMKGEGSMLQGKSEAEMGAKEQTAIIGYYDKAAKFCSTVIDIALQNDPVLPVELLQKAKLILSHVINLKDLTTELQTPSRAEVIQYVTGALALMFEDIAHFIENKYDYSMESILRR